MFNAILNALVSGATQTGAATQANTPTQPEGDLLSGMLGSLLTGQTGGMQSTAQNQMPQQSQPEGDMMSGLLGALLGGGQMGGAASQAPSQPQAAPQGDLMSGLLGSLLGGQPAPSGYPSSQQEQAQPDLMSGLLGSMLGGQTGYSQTNQAAANPLQGLVASGQNPLLNSLISPVVEKISAKLGIPPAIAMTVVTFAIQYMLSSQGKQVARGEDLSGVIQQYSDQKYLRTAGLSKELAQQTGLKPKVAASALSEAFLMLGADTPSNL